MPRGFQKTSDNPLHRNKLCINALKKHLNVIVDQCCSVIECVIHNDMSGTSVDTLTRRHLIFYAL